MLQKNPLYIQFLKEAEALDDSKIKTIADNFIKTVIARNVLQDPGDQQSIVQMCIDFLEFDSFKELAQEMTGADIHDIAKLASLFRDWEVIEAKEMMRVTEGRIKTIEKLQSLVDKNALEVPTLHNFLKEFPWVLDPRWTLIADETRYSQLLKRQFPDGDLPELDRRIDFLCVRESSNLIVVEIKRPRVKASVKQLDQIEEYVNFLRDHTSKTTDPDLKNKNVVGYLLCGDVVSSWQATEKRKNLEKSAIYVRLYSDLLAMVKSNHREFLDRYQKLSKAKKKSRDALRK